MGLNKVSLKEFFIFFVLLLIIIFLEIYRVSFIFNFHFNLFLLFLIFSLNYLSFFEFLILGGSGFFIFDYLFFDNLLFFLFGTLISSFFYLTFHRFFEKNNLFGILIFIFLGEILINSFFGLKNLISFSFLSELFLTLILGVIFWTILKFFE